MVIKRKIEYVVATTRRYVVRYAAPGNAIVCPECGDSMLSIEQATVLQGIGQRRIFKIIKMEPVHFSEAGTGALFVCLSSLAATVERSAQKETKELEEGYQ
ncbi:MAG: hypothetical protein IPJ30_03795 [Acidobacteria bacterium]|nr:hypothetical protein [Acidobacteriota bacterium]MBK8148951.1 hypothetical protein [Acidobacteriota bacterium]